MKGKHLFIPAMLLLALIAMSLTVKGALEQVVSDTKTRDFAEIPRSHVSKKFPRVCGVHSWRCDRRRSKVSKVKKIV